jgi:hypothetical protein
MTCQDNLEKPGFQNSCNFEVSNTGNIFVDLAYSVPCLASANNTYISTILSKQMKFLDNFKTVFFNMNYIYSYSDNLINGKYTSSTSDNGKIIKTIYNIPYQGEFKEEITTVITYFNKETNILFHEIPREFSNNSVEQASIAYIQFPDGIVKGTVNIPDSFVNDNIFIYLLDFNIQITSNITNNTNDLIAKPSVSESGSSNIIMECRENFNKLDPKTGKPTYPCYN